MQLTAVSAAASADCRSLFPTCATQLCHPPSRLSLALLLHVLPAQDPPFPLLLAQEDREVASSYFDAAVRNRTAKINDFFLKYLTGTTGVPAG